MTAEDKKATALQLVELAYQVTTRTPYEVSLELEFAVGVWGVVKIYNGDDLIDYLYIGTKKQVAEAVAKLTALLDELKEN